MTTTITKLTKPINSYHQWVASEITNGDILGVWESLGNRYARSVNIEAFGTGDTVIKFNVCKKIYKDYTSNDQHVNSGYGSIRPSPVLIAEIEEFPDSINILEGTARVWLISDLAIKDIKIISKSSDLRIEVS